MQPGDLVVVWKSASRNYQESYAVKSMSGATAIVSALKKHLQNPPTEATFLDDKGRGYWVMLEGEVL